MAGPAPLKAENQAATTPPNSYGDPNVYLNNALPVVATADLPAAGAAYNGRVVIEDAGGGTYNIVVYANGVRKSVALS